MGFRTIVVLNNDQCGAWSNDPQLGARIRDAMNHATGFPLPPAAALENYGSVVACQHADVQMLCAVTHFQVKPLAYSHWSSGQKSPEVELALLKEAAAKLGYRLAKMPSTDR